MKTLCLFAMLASAYDARTTEINLSHGYIEANPAMPARPSDGLLYGSALVGGAISCIGAHRMQPKHPRLAISLLVSVGGIHLVAGIHNQALPE